MWFKNLYLFKLESEFKLSAEELHEQLGNKPFKECSPTQRESLGWVAPLGRNSESLTHAANGYILVTMARQERLLPASVIREEMEHRVAEIELTEDRKVSNREKKDLREAIEFEFLPRAFLRTQKMDAWIDPRGQWVIVNTSSSTRAEEMATLLRKTLGSFPVAPAETENSPATSMTKWLKQGVLPTPFDFGHDCELKSEGDEAGVAAFKKHELMADEVVANLDAGKYVSKLGLIWDEKIQFMLTEDLQITRVKFLDVLEEQIQNEDPQTHAEHLDIEFSLMTGEVSKLLNQLLKNL
jgi:recombination associated protein RdgC